MTRKITDGLVRILAPRGIEVVVEASYFFTMMRGVQIKGRLTLSSSMRGIFHEDARTRTGFMEIISREPIPALLQEWLLTNALL